MSVYKENGYKDRADYLKSLTEEYNPDMVYMLADALGPTEDFDALITELEDYGNFSLEEE